MAQTTLSPMKGVVGFGRRGPPDKKFSTRLSGVRPSSVSIASAIRAIRGLWLRRSGRVCTAQSLELHFDNDRTEGARDLASVLWANAISFSI